ncbi:MAG TPA: hypothetical protein VMW08_00890 [Acidimicrobiales bacterium]|nr:hypothetical protein [Acidimicrobiales bacterium]
MSWELLAGVGAVVALGCGGGPVHLAELALSSGAFPLVSELFPENPRL